MWYDQLEVQEKSLVEQQVTNNQKNLLVAYILWFFLGMTGAHRFYANGATTASIIQLVMFASGVLTTGIFIGLFILLILGLWILIDAFLLPGIIKKQADGLRENLARDVLATRRGTSTADIEF